VHGDDRPLVEDEYGAGLPQQVEALVGRAVRRALYADEDRPLENGFVRERLLTLDGHVAEGVDQDVNAMRSPVRKPAQVQRGGDRLQLELVTERLRELAQRVVLIRGHDESHFWHRPIVSAELRDQSRPDSLSLVDSHLAGTKNGISERFVPDQDRGRLIEVEHVSRYRWAAQAANGRTVLDAGCGTGYGSRLLAEAGAQEVVGVDIAQGVLEAVAPAMPEQVRLQAGDLRKLDLDDDRFELVVCFEVIEHLADPFTALAELVRVLAPGGLLLVSSPNRGVYQPGNPHHLHEFAPSELAAQLTDRLSNVRLVRQSDYMASALLSDATVLQGGGAVVEDLVLHKLAAGAPGEEIYTIAMASDSALPDMHQLAAITGTLELREWLSVFETQTGAITDKDNYIDELEARLEERDRLADLLVDAERRLAEVPELNLRIADLEFELAAARTVADVARQEAKELDQMLMYGRRILRHVRPLIKPLRQARRRLRS
jgi:2-polyprenyl-3-methyl-5-hydroxy-6-metoxy-1,4-benzoquinol methylase